jgi:hypothetical protein
MASCRKTLEFSNAPYPPHRWGRKREGVKKLESGLSPKFNASSKTTEINTHVSTKNIGKIKSPLDNLNLNRGGDVWGELKEEILAYGQRWYTLTAQCRYIKGAPKRISKA